MKKFLLVSVLVLGTAVFATETVGTRMDEIDEQFKALQEQEQQLIEARRAEKVSAQERLKGQKALLGAVDKRVNQINNTKDYKYFREEYKILAKRYEDLKKDINTVINEETKLINSL